MDDDRDDGFSSTASRNRWWNKSPADSWKAETAEAAPETETPASEAPAAEETPAAPATPKAPPSVTGGSIGSLSEGYAANQSEDLGAVC